MDKVFVDTDIILDFLSIREPFYINAANLFSLADKGELQIFVSSLSFANLNYLLSKQYNTNEARKKLLKFKTLVSVLAVNEKTIELALASDFKDFEVGIQYFSAIRKGLKIILTRNLKDFKTADIAVMTAEEYLKGIL
jgi:predicted nucleic acid-binding protein